MKVTLVNPPYPKEAHQHPPLIPLSLGYLGAVCERNGHEVTVIDCQGERLSFEDFRRRLAHTDADVVGITSATLTYKSALKIADISKEILPECTTVLGGCHATFWDVNALNECPSLDVIVRKEGEITFLELLHKLEKREPLKDVKGITFRNGDKVVKNEDRPYIENLDDLPFPAHHLLNLNAYRKMGKLIIPLMTSRGCVYWCDFCTAVRMFGRKYRMRSPKNVVDELEYFHKKYNVEQFTFYDDTFTVDTKRVEEICDEMKRRKLDLQWDCETRVDMVNRPLLQKMKEAGCIAIWFGVESGSQMIIDKMHKKIKIEQTRKAFEMAHEVGLMTVASVILGFPGETEETAWETVNLVKSLDPNDVGFYIATPYPGTPLYETVKEKGWLKTEDFDKYDTATPVFETPYLKMEKLKEIRLKAYQQFYLRPRYMFKMLRVGGVYGIYAFRTAMAYLLRALHLKLS
ncbi:MAG: radical SAM protein [Nitrososphaerota archaeon]|nr:B12-binding domain-containing radical SAM protein [Candidatus Bathyarchaeota archaeon]MDW8024028.1 radical SAM protein [Nitrososphaerota archaeon]MDW8040579.1 radical SAM protein [Nitrososphaerota archaeon]